MDKEGTKKAIEVMQAFVDGKEIEFESKLYRSPYWKDLDDPNSPCWSWDASNYRVKRREIEVDEKGKLTIEVIHKGQYVKTLIIDGPCHFVEKMDD